jgi:hypothetical protein
MQFATTNFAITNRYYIMKIFNQLKIKMWIIICGFLLFDFFTVKAKVIIATVGTEVGVNAAIAQAKYGDTVQIPAGVWTWSVGNVNLSGITLEGAGTNATFIVDNLPNGWGNFAGFLAGTPVANALTRITGITFEDTGAGIQSYKGKILIDNRANNAIAPWRIDHCMFVNLNGNNIFPYGNGGLIDHCSFILQAEAVSQYGLSVDANNPWSGTLPNDPWGDLPYNNPLNYGSTNALYIESCYFTNNSGGGAAGAYDGYAGSISVFRNNILLNCAWYNHGNDTSGRYRSTRAFEIYNNIFIDNQNWVTAMDFRGGTGVVFSNMVTGFKLFDTIENYRNVQPNNFGGVDGTSPWDNNSTMTYYTGTNSITGNGITCTGANWVPHQWAGFVVSDPSAGSIAIGHGAGSVTYCLIQDNSADTLILAPAKDFLIICTNQDIFKINYVSNALDQVGRGSGDLISDVSGHTINTSTGMASYPRQVLEPLYSWGNTLNGSPSGITSGYANIIEGRDIYYNAVKPSYMPLPYPHPLDVLDISNKKLSPPSGLSAH